MTGISLEEFRATRDNPNLRHIRVPKDVYKPWPGLVGHHGAAKTINNTTELIDLRSEPNTEGVEAKRGLNAKFLDREIKEEIIWSVDDARLKNMVLHESGERVAYFSRIAGVIDSKIEANPKLYGWTRSDELRTKPLEGVTAMIEAPGAGGNYYHWSLEVMPRLMALVPLLKSGTIDRVALWHDRGKPFQRDYIDLILGEELTDRVISLGGKPSRFEHLVFFETRASSTRVTNLTVEFCRKIRSIVSSESGAPSVYVLRKPGNFRRLLEEEPLVERLGKLGFAMIEGGDFTLRQQIMAFRNASRVVGVHGAGLTNLAFADPDGTFIELTSTTYHRRVTYSDLALALGMKVKVIVLDEIGQYKSNTECPDLVCGSDAQLERLYAHITE